MEYETEEQQVEALKNWWAENGKSVILGVAIGAAAIVGWQWWNSHQLSKARQASDGFAETVAALDSGADAKAISDEVRDEFSGTLYATYSSLIAARASVEDGNMEAAVESLEWAADNSPVEEVALIAKVRLARVQGALGNTDAALSTLPSKVPAAFTAIVEEVRGDLYLAKGDIESARTAYQVALESGERAGNSAALTMKLDDLATGETTEEAS